MFTRAEKREIAGRARTLQERVEGPSNVADGRPLIDGDQLLDDWESFFPDERTFEKRLDADGLSRDAVRSQIAATHWPADEPLPDWLDRLDSMVRRVQSSDGTATLGESVSVADVAFGDLLGGVAAYGRDRLDDEIVPMDAVSPLVRWLVKQLEHAGVRALYVEFRSYLNQHDPELLDADPDDFDDPPTEYYDQFVDAMFDGGVKNLCLEYPVLARQWVTLTDQFVETTTELCRRLRRDRSALTDRFGVDGAVTDLEPLSEDKHADGRVPVHVTFETGDVVYKPRSVSAGRAFYTVVERVDDHLSTPSFETPSYLSRDTYGWMETVEYRDPTDEAAVERYYERAGVLLCLAYALNFNDCQLENLIVSGESPVLIDGETLLHPGVAPADSPGKSEYLAAVTRSVLLTSLLPYSLGNPRETEADGILEQLAGFGETTEDAELNSVVRPRIEGKNTDVMTVEGAPSTFERTFNTPTLDGRDRPPEAYADSILRGFEETYETILDLRSEGEFFSAVLTSDLVDDLRVRLLYRATGRYVSVLNATSGRKPLQDGVQFSVETERLVAPFFDGTVETGAFWDVYDAERRALYRRDIPRFGARADDDTVYHDRSTVDASLDIESGYERVRKRVEGFDRTDLRRQRWLVRRSLQVVDSEGQPPSPTSVTDDRLRRVATELFDSGLDAGFDVGGRTGWASISPRNTPLSVIAADESLYYGRSGIALTAAALAAVGGPETDGYRRCVDEILAPVIDRIESEDPSFRLGGTLGVGSVVYALSVVADLLEVDRYRELATKAAHTISDDRLRNDDTYDVTDGSSGTLLGLLAHHERFGNRAVLDRAVACGERLLDARVPVGDEGHRVWRGAYDTVYTGFSHGSAGIAYALARLSDATGADRFADAAREAVAFESTLYSSERVNWPQTPNEETYQDRWCHGRTGMALSRIGVARHLGDESLRQEAETTLSAVASAEPSNVDHLCCGNLGRAEALLVGSRRGLVDARAAEQVVGRCLARHEQTGTLALKGHSSTFTNPTWFNGVSGAAYTFLRMRDPDALPSVLLFE